MMGKPEMTRRTLLLGAGAASAFGVLAWPARSLAAATSSPDMAGRSAANGSQGRAWPAVLDVDELEDAGPLQRRWLSLPYSRLVVNPTDSATNLSPLQQTAARDLPLHLGYFAADEGFRLRNLAGLYRRTADNPGAIDVAWSDDFDVLDQAWVADPYVDATTSGGQLRLNLQAASSNWWGAIQQWVEVDLDRTPFLQIKVDSLADAWGLRLHDGSREITIQADSNSTGAFTYDLAQLTGWRGTRRFQVVIRVAVWNKPATFDFVRIAGVQPVLADAASFTTSWRPSDLTFTARHADGSAVAGFDCFFDADSVLRSVSITPPASGPREWTLVGQYAGSPSWTPQTRTLTVTTEHFSYALALSARVAGDPAFYPTLLEVISDADRRDQPADEGWWALRLPLDGDAGRARTFDVAVGFATAGEGGGATAARRALAALRAGAQPTRVRRREWWNKCLTRVPLPLDFALRAVPTLGVSASEVRRNYYTAWAYVAANTLPQMQEAGYAYPQAPAGKPSMWTEGAPGARASASWESMFAIQFLAYLDPDGAWQAFRGMMSLVGSDGQLAGEGLPTRKAETALILHQLTGDRRALRDTYPAVRRHVLWAADNPRWIFKDHDFADEKDAQFAFSALIDMAYARDIAEILDLPEDVKFWRAKRASYQRDCQHWFWPTPTSDPYEYYRESTGQRSPGNPLWIGSGILVDLWPDDSPYLQGLVRRLMRAYRPEAVYAGMSQVKFPDIEYTSYGLLLRGMREEATVLMNANLRDVIRANSFAETYSGNPPAGAGVRPSQNGASTVIATVWMNNGYRFDRGWPHLLRWTEDAGGLLGVPVQGRRLDVRVPADSPDVQLAGSFVHDDPHCRQLEVPLGETRPVPTGCTTV